MKSCKFGYDLTVLLVLSTWPLPSGSRQSFLTGLILVDGITRLEVAFELCVAADLASVSAIDYDQYAFFTSWGL